MIVAAAPAYAPTDVDSPWWDDELDACSADPAYLIDQHGVIDKPRRPGAEDEEAPDAATEPAPGGTVRFRLWPDQTETMGSLVLERLTLILKARQLGISWLVCGYVLWLVLFHPHQIVFLYSKGQGEANELLRRIKVLYERLPEGLRLRLPKIQGKDNTRELEFSNGSLIRSMPATKKAGIGYTASLVVLDEWAHQSWGDVLYEMVKPTMEAGGQLIILSTANGIGNWFHALWDRAVKGQNGFRTIFLPWWSRPGRDLAWYAGVLRNSTDPEKVKENYPANPVEAFRASGRVRFPHAWIEAQAAHVIDAPEPAHVWPGNLRGIPGLRLYRLPEYGRRYGVFADTAEGKETSNYDAGLVLDLDTLEEVALLHGQWEPDIYAHWLMALGYAYTELPEETPAVLVPERNNHGHAVLVALKLKGYPNIGVGHDGDPGWLTNPQTKPVMIDLLAAALRDATITVHSQAALSEFSTYKRLKGGATGAESGYFDDITMAWAVALAWIQDQAAKTVARKVQAIPSLLAGYRGTRKMATTPRGTRR